MLGYLFEWLILMVLVGLVLKIFGENLKSEHGLYFKTKEEAEQHLKERKLLFKLHQWAKEKNDGWEPDFTNDEIKYYISCECSYGGKKLKVDWYINSVKFLKLPYFKTIEIARECIDIFGDEIIEVLVNDRN